MAEPPRVQRVHRVLYNHTTNHVPHGLGSARPEAPAPAAAGTHIRFSSSIMHRIVSIRKQCHGVVVFRSVRVWKASASIVAVTAAVTEVATEVADRRPRHSA